MGRHYNEIKRYLDSGKGTIKEWRQNFDYLQHKLKERKVRYALYEELNEVGDKDMLELRTAMTTIWKSFFATAIHTLVSRFEGGGKGARAKPTTNDFKIPRSMLESFRDLLEDPDLSHCLKPDPEEIVHHVFKYVMDNLSSQAMEPGRLELLGTLDILCDTNEFVNVLKDRWVSEIFGEIDSFLDDDSPGEVIQICLKIMMNLVRSCISVGIDMEIYMGDIFAIIADYVKSCKDEKRATELLLCASRLMRSHPHHAVGVLSKYGNLFLNRAQKLFGTHYLELTEYFIAHIIVNQVAGELGGLRPGDVGDLGKASLTLDRVSRLLDMVTESNLFKRVMEDARTGWHRTGKGGGIIKTWCPLTERQKRHLELCARLMALAQRQYLAQQEWKKLGSDFEDKLIEEVDWTEDPQDEELVSRREPIDETQLQQSPWVRKCLLPLLSHITIEHESHTPVMESSTGPSLSQGSISKDLLFEDFPLLSGLGSESSSTAVLGSIQLIVACTEAFPFGESWAMRNHKGWRTYDPFEAYSGLSHYVKCADPNDLAALLRIFVFLLHSFGSPRADVETCGWLLLCLLKLTKASCNICYKANSSVAFVAESWEKIWLTIMKSELLFMSYTRSASTGSLGDVVLQLLQQISRRCCNVAFLRQHQPRLWELPIFRSNSLHEAAPSLFDLVSFTIVNTGVVEKLGPSCALPPVEGQTDSVRARLLHLGLNILQTMQSKNNRVVPDSRTQESVCQMILSLFAVRSAPGDCVTDFAVTEMYLSCQPKSYPFQRFSQKRELEDDYVHGQRRRSQVLEQSIIEENTRPIFVSPRDIDTAVNMLLEACPTIDLANDEGREHLIIAHSIHVGLLVRLATKTKLPQDSFDHIKEKLKAMLVDLVDTACANVTGLKGNQFVWKTFLCSLKAVYNCAKHHSKMLLFWRESGSFLSAAEKVWDVCLKELQTYCEFRRGVLTLPTQVKSFRRKDDDWMDGDEETFSRPTKTTFFNEDDEDENDEMERSPMRRKRKGGRGPSRSPSRSPKRRNTSTFDPSTKPVRSEEIHLIAELMLALKSNGETCKLIYEKLSLFEDGYELSIGAEKLDSVAALNVLKIISEAVPLQQDDESLCSIWVSILNDVRESEFANSFDFLMAYDATTKFLTRLGPITAASVKDVKDVLELTKVRGLRYRSALSGGVDSLACALFEAGDSTFHENFDGFFASHYVLGKWNLKSLSWRKRYRANMAMASFTCTMSKQEEIVASVTRELAGTSPDHSSGLLILAIERYDSVRSGSNENGKQQEADIDTNVEARKESPMSWHASVLMSWSLLCGCTTDELLFQRLLYDIIHLAAERPHLEPLCFIALQRIAQLCRTDLHALVRSELSTLVSRWVQNRRPLRSAPLLLTAPTILEAMIESVGPLLHVGLEKGDSPLIALREQAMVEFVHTFSGLHMPVILANEELDDDFLKVNVDSDTDFDRTGGQLLEALQLMDDESGEKLQDGRTHTIFEALVPYAGELMGFGVSELVWNEDPSSGERCVKLGRLLLRSLDPKLQNDHIQKSMMRSLKSILSRGVVSATYGGVLTMTMQFSEVAPMKSGDDFARAIGSSIMEHITIVRGWLRAGRKRKRGVILSLFLSICVNILDDSRLDEESSSRSRRLFLVAMGYLMEFTKEGSTVEEDKQVVKWLLKYILEILPLLNSSESDFEIRSFVASIISIHSSYQEQVVASCNVQKNSQGSVNNAQSVLGSCEMIDEGEIWDSPPDTDLNKSLLELQSNGSPELEILRLTTEIVRKFLDNKPADSLVWLSCPIFRSTPCSEHLFKVDCDFAVQKEIEHEVMKSQPTLGDSVRVFLKMVDYIENDASEVVDTITEEILVGVMDQIRSRLTRVGVFREFRLGEATGSRVSPPNQAEQLLIENTLSSTLGLLLNTSLPLSVKLAASRLLGQSTKVVKQQGENKHQPLNRWPKDLWKRDQENGVIVFNVWSIRLWFCSICLQVASKYFRHGKASASLASLNACKAILNTKNGDASFQLLSCKSSKVLLDQLRNDLMNEKSCKLDFPTHLIEFLNKDSCWSDHWWTISTGDSFSYGTWLKGLVCSLIWHCYGNKKDAFIRGKADFIRALPRLCWLEIEFAASVFHWILVDLVISVGAEDSNDGDTLSPIHTRKEGQLARPRSSAIGTVSSCISKLLNSCFSLSSPETKKVISLLANALDKLRTLAQEAFISNPLHSPRKRSSPASQNEIPFWTGLQLQPALVVQCFMNAGQPASAAFYAELFLTRPKPEGGAHDMDVLRLLRDCHVAMKEGEVADALDLRISSERFYDFQFNMSNDSSLASPSRALNSSVLVRLQEVASIDQNDVLRSYVSALASSTATLNLSPFESRDIRELWFSRSLWFDLEHEIQTVALPESELSPDFFESVSLALDAFDRDDRLAFDHHLLSARYRALDELDCDYGSRFRVLNEVEEIGFESIEGEPDKALGLIPSWSQSILDDSEGLSNGLSFATRARLLGARTRRSKSRMRERQLLFRHLWSGALATRSRHAKMALRSVQRMLREELSESDTDVAVWLRVRLEECVQLESHGQFSMAIQGCNLLREGFEDSSERWPKLPSLHADSLLYGGRFTSKYRVDSVKNVRELYFEPLAKMCRKLWLEEQTPKSARRAFSAHIELAETSSQLFSGTMDRLRSPEWVSKMKHLNMLEKKHQEMQSVLSSKKPARSGLTDHEIQALNWQIRNISKDIRLLQDEKEKEELPIKTYLSESLENFALALSLSSASAESNAKYVIRMLLLWFSSWQQYEFVNTTMDAHIQVIPTYVFVPLTYQVFSRLDTSHNKEFQDILSGLVRRMASDHPYHCMPQLDALCNGEMINGMRSNISNSKAAAASIIFDHLLSSKDERIKGLAHSYREAARAYIIFALAKTRHFEQKKIFKNIKISAVVKSAKARLTEIFEKQKYKPCLFTRPPHLQADKDYGNGFVEPIGTELIGKFDTKFEITTTGIHRPKIVFCIGSTGGRYKQLVKSYDDIRQDAVMQQVFRYTNSILRNLDQDVRGYRHPLNLVTYTTIPLSPDTGVLEWVMDTQSFNSLVASKGKKIGLHERYNCGEWTNSECKAKLDKAPASDKRITFDKICANFSPSFRYFFVEQFRNDLAEWHEAKLRYTRSCAVCSMVGHILGIGDRHAENILIKQSGEMVHIDFGIVFERGRLLPTPETVPFRLTRDVVDGFGPCGTTGPFSRAAEETLRVLRDNKSALLIILSAIVADPLFKWTEAAKKVGRKQREVDQGNELVVAMDGGIERDQNELGVAVIEKIKEKLDGREEGTSNEQQSVEGQVRHLINQARDHDNLCRLFPGWSPWL